MKNYLCLLAAATLILCGCANIGGRQTESSDTIMVPSMCEDTMAEVSTSRDTAASVAKNIDAEVTITGTLKMMVSLACESARVEKYTTEKGEVKYRLVHTDPEEESWVSEYYVLEGEGEHFAYVLCLDKPLDVTPYINREEMEWIDPMVSRIMIVRDNVIPGKDFADTYASKHVSITGTFFVPKAGCAYVTEVVMDMNKIEIVN